MTSELTVLPVTSERTVRPPTSASLVVGAGGLLGSALTDALRAAGTTAVLTSSVGWTTGHAGADLDNAIDALAGMVRPHRLPWRVAWCAGAGVTGTGDDALHQEVGTLRSFFDRLARTAGLGPGTVFLASSAGGLYAGGGTGGPYDERDPVAPISAYGRAKLATEQLGRRFADDTGSTVLVGRIANLYGPGQNLAKGQGLISQLCRSNLTRQPVSIYVPLDTIRDYLYADDCAAMIVDMLALAERAETDLLPHGRRRGGGGTVVKVLASQHGTTIAALIAACRQVFKRAPLLVLGSSANARLQVKDLRFRSVVWPEIDRRTLTTLPAGVSATAAGLLRGLQTASRLPVR